MSTASIRIVVEVRVLNDHLQRLQERLGQVRRFMEAVNNIMNVISTVAWVSPSSAALLAKYRLLFRQIEEAMRIVEEYIQNITSVRDRFLGVEQQVQNRIEGLRTDVFGI